MENRWDCGKNGKRQTSEETDFGIELERSSDEKRNTVNCCLSGNKVNKQAIDLNVVYLSIVVTL